MTTRGEIGRSDVRGILTLSAAAGCLALAVIGTIKTTPESKTLFVDCGDDQAAGAIFDLNTEKFPAHFELMLDNGSNTKSVFVTHGGHLLVDGTTVLSDDADKTLTTMNGGARLIAGAPTPQTLDGYYAGDEALTLACKKATPASVAHSQAEMTAITS